MTVCSSESGNHHAHSWHPHLLPPSLTITPSPSSPTAPPPSPNINVGGSLTRTIKDPRKDSGIRSRRSSIQTQIFSMNGLNTGDLLVHRVSDYFTASHSSINEKYEETEGKHIFGRPGTSTLVECEKKFLHMRKQSDLQMIKCVQQERTHRPYVMVTPLSPFTLFFLDEELEKTYRQRAHRPRKDEPRTLASTLYNTYFDIFVTALVYFGVSISLLLLFGLSILWIVFFVVSSTWHFIILCLCLYKVISSARKKIEDSALVGRMYSILTRWRPWHVCGATLLCLPLAIVFAEFSCRNLKEKDHSVQFFCYIAAVSLINFCNFTQLNCWMKNVLASIGTIIFLCLLGPPLCACWVLLPASNLTIVEPLMSINDQLFNTSEQFSNWTISDEDTFVYPKHRFHIELIIAYLLLLVLVWLLNREFEIGYRLSFYGYIMAMKDKVNVQNMKNQAEWLLHNIIPQHVANTIKTTAKYSKNHKKVGIMFASIINFNELYNEDYSSGKEYLRFLNELVADFDELLTKDKYKNIEKIKTIGSTYMAASGLNPQLRQANAHPNQHICDLVDFAKELYRVIENFNQNMIGFKFILRIGLNCGDVTAGVIGTTKLFYDIWGDAVNIASRMDSTGVPNNIQVTEECAQILRPLYALKHRGSVYVKGKDNMDVFLVEFENGEEKDR